MSNKNGTTANSGHPASITKRILIGAGIALVLVIIFLIGGGEGDPAWSDYWRIRPVIVVTLAGAAGGIFYHIMDNLRQKGGWKWLVANILSLIVYVFGLWMGAVLGFNGTMWN